MIEEITDIEAFKKNSKKDQERKEIKDYLDYYRLEKDNSSLINEKDIWNNKILTMKLNGTYRKILSINNDINKLELIEEKNYNNYNIKTDDEKILFELKRISVKLSKMKYIPKDISREYSDLIFCCKLLGNFNSKNSNLKKIKKLLQDVYECIIVLELKLGMEVGLYKEIIDFVEKEKINNINEQKEFIDDVKIRKLDLVDEHGNKRII